MLLIKNSKLRMGCGFLETFSFLALKLWLKNPAGARRFPGLSFRTYMSLVRRDRWQSKPIDDLIDVGSGVRITLEHIRGGGVTNVVDELAYMALITKTASPKHVFEIGTFRGRTALNFALNSPEDCVVYTLDLPPEGKQEFATQTNVADARIIEASKPGIDYAGKPGAEKIRQLYGDSTRFDFSPYLGRMDLVFVDGAHHYDAVVSDTRNALKLVRPGGWILWHDFANYGDYNDVTRAVRDLIPIEQVTQIDNTQLACYRAAVA